MKAESLERFGTSRLHAERLRAEHLAALLALHANPRMMATLGGVRSEAQTRAYLAANLDHWEHYGFGLWMLRDRAGRLAGRAGLRRVAITGAQETEIAYALLPEFWG
ncbi:MAG: GNAT family N-acetyltransferase, partial [Stellaceae bacterium]